MAAELSVTRSDDGSTLHVAGELDTHTSTAFAQELDCVEATVDLVLDLSATRFLSSAGLSVILTAQRRHDDAGGSLTVSAVTPAVGRLFALSGVSDQLGIS